MSIFNLEKTPEEAKREEVRRQASYRRDVFVDFARATYQAYNDFWNNPTVTPQEQCDLLGAEAINLFAKHASAVTFILTNMPEITETIPEFMSVTASPVDKVIVGASPETYQGGFITIQDKDAEVA